MSDDDHNYTEFERKFIQDAKKHVTSSFLVFMKSFQAKYPDFDIKCEYVLNIIAFVFVELFLDTMITTGYPKSEITDCYQIICSHISRMIDEYLEKSDEESNQKETIQIKA